MQDLALLGCLLCDEDLPVVLLQVQVRCEQLQFDVLNVVTPEPAKALMPRMFQGAKHRVTASQTQLSKFVPTLGFLSQILSPCTCH